MTGTTAGPPRTRRGGAVALTVGAIVLVLVVLAVAFAVLVHRRSQLPPSIYGRTESTEAPLARPAPGPPPGTVTIYGADGTFGAAADASSHPRTVAVPNWSFDPGAAAFFTGVTANGRVLIGTVPQTDNQAAPTGATMSIGVLDPAAPGGPAFATLRIPTSGGAERATTVNSDTGGADVSDLCAVTTTDGPRVTAISSMPYKLWELDTGEFPAVVSLVDDARTPGPGAVRIDKARTREPEALRASDAGRAALPVGAGASDALPSPPGFTECDRLPSGDLAATQYFPTAGHHSGGLVALDPDGHVVAFHQTTEVTLASDLTVGSGGTTVRVPAGTPVTLSPREVRADPHTTDRRDQRFVVVYDTGADAPAPSGTTAPSRSGHLGLPELIQELRYDADAHTIEPTSPFLVLRDEHTSGDPATDLVFAYTTAYAPDGTLFVTRTHAGSVLSASTAVFRPGTLGSRPVTPGPLGSVTVPDATLAAFDGAATRSTAGNTDFGATFSIDYDPKRDLLIQVSAGNAAMRAVHWPGWSGDDPARAADGSLCQVDLGGPALAAANPSAHFEARQGAIDPAGASLFLAYEGFQGTDDPRHNITLPQFVFQVNLDAIAACR